MQLFCLSICFSVSLLKTEIIVELIMLDEG